MTAVYKRELRSYFTSMVGYVFIAILIFFVGIYFMAYNLFGGYPSFGYVLLSCTIIFMVAVPILTMRSMAEDRRGKTDQLLLTSPVSLTGIVLGKYLAMVTVLLVPILLICFCPLIIAMNGSATLTADYAAILAFFCMGCVYIAVGMFVSALTESQIIAAVGTFAALLVLYLWTDLVSFLPDSLAQLLSSFDFQGVLDNFAYYSVFDLGGLLLYLSMAAVFVFLTVQVLQRRKGITSAATTAVVLAIAVVVNLVVGQLPSDLVERDISDNSLYTVSDTSVDYLSALERDVELVVLASEDTTDQRITKFLHNYAALSGHLSLSFVDPVEHPYWTMFFNMFSYRSLLYAVLYFLLLRPEKKRKQQAQQMRDGLKKGDTITTIGGVIGKVVSVDKDTFVIETSEDRVRVQFAKWALSQVGVQTGEQPENKKEKKEDEKQEEPKEEAQEADTSAAAEESAAEPAAEAPAAEAAEEKN